MKNANRIAFCGLISALSVLLLFLGGVTFILAYVMPMLVGLLMLMLKRTFGTPSAWITYTAVSLLSLILVADKECMLMYIFFFGFYPILQPDINRIKPKLIRYLIKFIIFNSMIAVAQLLLVFVFGVPFLDEGEGKVFIAVFVILMNLLFVIYDRLIDRISYLYELKLEKRIKKFLKK